MFQHNPRPRRAPQVKWRPADCRHALATHLVYLAGLTDGNGSRPDQGTVAALLAVSRKLRRPGRIPRRVFAELDAAVNAFEAGIGD